MKRYYRQKWYTASKQQSGSPGMAFLAVLVLAGLMALAVWQFGALGTSNIKEAVVYILVDGEYSGSGSLISPNGNIITNKHVVFPEGRKAEKIEVWLNSGTPRKKTYPAEITDYDKVDAKLDDDRTLYHDWAVIKINSDRPLPYLRIGDSKRLKESMDVISAGFPYGQSPGPNKNGVIVKIERGSVTRLRPDDQGGLISIGHSCRIAPGSSGGPLCDARGAIVGINSKLFVPGDEPDPNENFAIPSHSLDHVWKQYAGSGVKN